MLKVTLSRRNLLTLLSKLDRVKAGGVSECTIIKHDSMHERERCIVEAQEDDVYYFDRVPGDVHPSDDPS